MVLPVQPQEDILVVAVVEDLDQVLRKLLVVMVEVALAEVVIKQELMEL
jgi:hypothetical protein